MEITIIDYGMGNLHSIEKKIKSLGHIPTITSNPAIILKADKIILPGVGHFKKAMENLKALHLIGTLNEAVLVNEKPILGICLGMQLMAKKSEEGKTEGLNWLNAEVVKFNVNNTLKFKIPHTGWNQVSIAKESRLMKNIDNNAEFYFVHSYHIKTEDPTIILNETEYEYKYPSALEKDNIFGVQYHPEKSHDVGAQLLKNFIEL